MSSVVMSPREGTRLIFRFRSRDERDNDEEEQEEAEEDDDDITTDVVAISHCDDDDDDNEVDKGTFESLFLSQRENREELAIEEAWLLEKQDGEMEEEGKGEREEEEEQEGDGEVF